VFRYPLFRFLLRQTQIFGQDTISFQKLPDLVNRFLIAPDPVVLHYIINPGTPPPERPQAYDVEIKTEDTVLKQKMSVTITTSKESGQTLLKLDEEVIFFLDLLTAFIDDFFFLRSPSLLSHYKTLT